MTKRTYTLYDWDDGSERKVQVIYNDGIYQLRIEGELIGDYSNMAQIEEEINKTMRLYGWHFIPKY